MKSSFLIERSSRFKRKVFSLLLPPPNVTGQLHFGHFLDHAIADVCARWNSLKGYDIIWPVSLDHAGIATENVAKKNGFTTLQQISSFAKKKKSIITKQLKKSDLLLSWKKGISFTLDKDFSSLTDKVLKRLVKEEMLYVGNYIVNWCYNCKTSLSDEEVEHEETSNSIFYIQYDKLVVATTRPETLFGDVAIFTNKKLSIQYVSIPIIERKIPVLYSDKIEDFGTGNVKATPAHSKIDYDLCTLNNITEVINVFDKNGKCLIKDKNLNIFGKSVMDVRKIVIQMLQDRNLICAIVKQKSNVPKCYRCGSVTDHIISRQLFLKTKQMMGYVEKFINEKVISPAHLVAQSNEWIANIKDWCISRQIKYGKRINLYSCLSCMKLFIRKRKCLCGGSVVSNKDVLDTWFTSSLCAILSSRKSNNKISLLVTGRDILYFWVLRMYMMNFFFKGEPIISKVFFHGLVRDKIGRKLSKSLNNSPDLEEMRDKVGNDAIRYDMLLNQRKNDDFNYNFDKVGETFERIKRKVLNISRLYSLWSKKKKNIFEAYKNLSTLDKGFLSSVVYPYLKELDYFISEVDTKNATIRFNELLFNRFASEYLETLKMSFFLPYDGKYAVFGILLSLLHVFVPSFAKEVWKKHFTGKIDQVTLKLSNFSISSSYNIMWRAISLIRAIPHSIGKELLLCFKDSEVNNMFLLNKGIFDTLGFNIKFDKTRNILFENEFFTICLPFTNSSFYHPFNSDQKVLEYPSGMFCFDIWHLQIQNDRMNLKRILMEK